MIRRVSILSCHGQLGLDGKWGMDHELMAWNGRRRYNRIRYYGKAGTLLIRSRRRPNKQKIIRWSCSKVNLLNSLLILS